MCIFVHKYSWKQTKKVSFFRGTDNEIMECMESKTRGLYCNTCLKTRNCSPLFLSNAWKKASGYNAGCKMHCLHKSERICVVYTIISVKHGEHSVYISKCPACPSKHLLVSTMAYNMLALIYTGVYC